MSVSDDELKLSAPVARAELVTDEDVERLTRPRDVVAELPPDVPHAYLLQGVLFFPWRQQNLLRWASLSVGLWLAGTLSWYTIAAMMALGVPWDPNAIRAGAAFLPAFFSILLTGCYGSALILAIIKDTAFGHNDLANPPTSNWHDWVSSCRYPSYSLVVAGLIGYFISLPLPAFQAPFAIIIANLLFPLFLLSSLETRNALGIASGPVLRSIPSMIGPWIGFQSISQSLVASVVAIIWVWFPSMPYLCVLCTAPLVAAVIMIYARLLGRIAWRAATLDRSRSELSDLP